MEGGVEGGRRGGWRWKGGRREVEGGGRWGGGRWRVGWKDEWMLRWTGVERIEGVEGGRM